MKTPKVRMPHPKTSHVLTRAEVVRMIERGARDRRQMSALELVNAFRAGTLYAPGEVADLLGMASLLPKRDRLFVES
jgi:hypothetical protein